MPLRPLDRRTLLKGAGVTLALPFLEAMLPFNRSWAAPLGGAHFATLYMGNGMLTGRDNGAQDFWSCAGSPTGITTWSTPLRELQGFKDSLTLIQNCGFGRLQNSGDAGHEQAAPSFLTGQNIANDSNAQPPTAGAVNVSRLAGPGMSLDRLIAGRTQTPLKTLNMAASPSNGGYVNTDPRSQMMANISWDSQTKHLNDETIRSARDVFNRLTASGLNDRATRDGGTAPGPTDAGLSVAAQRALQKKSVLDAVSRDLSALNARLGTADRAIVDQYATSLRQIERDLEASLPRDAGTPGGGADHGQAVCTLPTSQQQAAYNALGQASYQTITQNVRLMIDLMALSFQCGLTNVGTLMLSYDWSTVPTGQFNAAYGVANITGPDHYHNASHYQSDGASGGSLGAVQGINTWHVKQAAYLAQVFKNTLDSDGRSLLDNSVVLFGAGMGDPDLHFFGRMSRIILGKGLTLAPGPNGKLIDAKGGDLAHPKLLQTIANAYGVTDTIGESGQGTISGIF